jgi:hypothetical protein
VLGKCFVVWAHALVGSGRKHRDFVMSELPKSMHAKHLDGKVVAIVQGQPSAHIQATLPAIQGCLSHGNASGSRLARRGPGA